MSKKKVTNPRVPRTHAGGEWTEAKFWSFIRSNIRATSRKWPPLVRQALHDARRPYDGPNKRQKWEYQCAECSDWFMGKFVQVDHIVPCGTLRSFEDLEGFYRRMFVEKDGLRVLCKTCHQHKTNPSSYSKAKAVRVRTRNQKI